MNQVNKVITEDLVLAVELRKPEQLKQFYISLLEKPGCEVNMSSLSRELGISVQQIEKYLPLLQMTDLIRSASKFRKSSVRERTGSQKFYPVDLALRNAVLRLGREVLNDPGTLGLYAETLVFNALKKWLGTLRVDYYRESQMEVDFVVHTRPMQYLPIEVKYSSKISQDDVKGVHRFRSRFHCSMPFVITKDRDAFGLDEDLGVFKIPLILFLLMFD
jgi:predicted AAA+ superfamily ATPase